MESIQDQPAEESIEDKVIKGVISGELGNHNEHWDEQDPVVARVALVKADSLRKQHTDPGDAYLQGISDQSAIVRAIPEVNEFERIYNLTDPIELEAS